MAGTERRLQPARVRKKMRNLSELESSAITTWTHAVITIYLDTEVWTRELGRVDECLSW